MPRLGKDGEANEECRIVWREEEEDLVDEFIWQNQRDKGTISAVFGDGIARSAKSEDGHAISEDGFAIFRDGFARCGKTGTQPPLERPPKLVQRTLSRNNGILGLKLNMKAKYKPPKPCLGSVNELAPRLLRQHRHGLCSTAWGSSMLGTSFKSYSLLESTSWSFYRQNQDSWFTKNYRTRLDKFNNAQMMQLVCYRSGWAPLPWCCQGTARSRVRLS